MKKTLFILLALGSVAAAGTSTSTYTGTDSTSQTEEETSPNKYQVDENGNITTVFEVNGEETVYTNDFPYEVEAGYDNDDSTADGKIYNAVHIGDAGDYGKVTIHSDANHAESYVVNEGGTLVFVGETKQDGVTNTTTAAGKTVQDILTTTTGTGNLVLRTPDQQTGGENSKANRLQFVLNGASQLTGNLLISPVPVVNGYAGQQSSVHMHLEDEADISSFRSIMTGSGESEILIDGKLAELSSTDPTRGHINNLYLYGSSRTYIGINTAENEEIFLGGNTVIASHQYTGDSSENASLMRFGLETEGASVRIKHLTDEGESTAMLYFESGFTENSTTTDEELAPINATFTIDSFDYNGYVYVNAHRDGSVQGEINLLRDESVHQKLYDYQLWATTYENVDAELAVTLDGAGTYVLSTGISILPRYAFMSTRNFATLSEDWIGTVEVNRLVADIDFSDYGNANSTVHFKGFQGAVVVRNAGTTEIPAAEVITVAPDIILENVAAVQGSGGSVDQDAMYGFEIIGAPEGCTSQKLVFEGDISGDGDFVINTTVEEDNTTVEEDITFTGDLSGWVEADETSEQTPVLLAAAGSHKVTFSGNVAELNADVMTANDAGLQVSFARSGETEVNGIISHEAGGKMDLSVAQGTTVTFNDTVDVDTAAISGTAKVDTANTFTAGSVTISGRTDASVATLGSGVQVSANSVSGGTVAQSLVDLKSGSSLSVSDVVMSDTTVTADAGQTVKLSGVTADTVFYNNVVLSGSNVSYVVQPAVTDKFIAAEDNIRKISMSTSALSGMTLAADANAQITLADSSVSGWTADNMPEVGDKLAEITIVLSGFVMDYVVQNGTVNGALAELKTDTWLDGLSLNNTVLNRLDLTNATITYSQSFFGQDLGDPYYNNYCNTLTIKIKDATYAIPEPTTATLSLLALAGLAARRRRR